MKQYVVQEKLREAYMKDKKHVKSVLHLREAMPLCIIKSV